MAARVLRLVSQNLHLFPACRRPIYPSTLKKFSSTSKALGRILYSEHHEYVNIADDNSTAKVGITDHAQKELGDVVYVDLPEAEGQELGRGEVLCSLESVKAVAEVYLPISGKIRAVNDQLSSVPGLVNSDTYTDGWLAEVDITQPAELEGLMSEADYDNYLKESD